MWCLYVFVCLCVLGFAGTPGYLSPEVLRKDPYGKPVDMWACGKTMGLTCLIGGSLEEQLLIISCTQMSWPETANHRPSLGIIKRTAKEHTALRTEPLVLVQSPSLCRKERIRVFPK